MVRQPIQIFLRMFWTRTNSKSFYKIIKSPNPKLLKVSWDGSIHSNHYLPSWYVANREDITKNSHGKRRNDVSIATFRFCDQLQKISPALCETNGVSGLCNRHRENDFFSFREKIKTCVLTMSADFQATRNFSLKSHKVSWPVVINCLGHFTNSNPVSI